MYFFFLEIFHSFSKEEEEEETKRTFFVDCHFFVSLLPISFALPPALVSDTMFVYCLSYSCFIDLLSLC